MNYKKMKERIERKEKSVRDLIEFLRESSYPEIMTQMAIAQTSIMELIDVANIQGFKKGNDEITLFFSTIQCLMIHLQDLSDFAQIENNDE